MREIKLDRIKQYKLQEILQEANLLYSLSNRSNLLLPLKGIYFNEKTQVLHVYLPAKVSLFSILHEGTYQRLQSIEKLIIAKKVAKALYHIHRMNMGGDMKLAHGHISSKNIFVNLRDMEVQVGDFGLFTLKKFCKLFHNYQMVNQWSAPEVWESLFLPRGDVGDDDLGYSEISKYDPKATFFNKPSVDIYSFGFLLWELETGKRPFEQETPEEVFSLLTGNKVRPKISDDTNKQLALLIRRCWQDNAEKRPSLSKIMDSLKICEFSSK